MKDSIWFVVDAYNLLFRTLSGQSLRDDRDIVIGGLNRVAKAKKLNLTLVFDALHTEEPLTRGHYQSLEIVYTAKRQTADEYIIDLVEMASNSSRIVVVTSDNALTKHVRSFGAKTLSVAGFISWIGKEKKVREVVATKEKSVLPPKRIKWEGSLAWYEDVFEEKLKKEEL